MLVPYLSRTSLIPVSYLSHTCLILVSYLSHTLSHTCLTNQAAMRLRCTACGHIMVGALASGRIEGTRVTTRPSLPHQPHLPPPRTHAHTYIHARVAAAHWQKHWQATSRPGNTRGRAATRTSCRPEQAATTAPRCTQARRRSPTRCESKPYVY